MRQSPASPYEIKLTPHANDMNTTAYAVFE